ncbi:DnaJ sub C member 27 [Boothiomyces sp. JEL0866]|nr:DnaJ sub C member 27 [Boothiomyces sp. JEL0866]
MAEVKQPDNKGLTKIVNDLGKRFSQRSTPAELVQKNILREDEASGVSSTIIQQKMALEEEKKKDTLARKISMRPSKTDLKDKNILKGEGDVEEEEVPSPSIESRAIQLKSCLKKRPDKAQLEQKNILKSNGLSPALAAAQEQLKRSILEDTLENKIRDRPPVEELEAAKILIFAETVEVLPTFRKSEYNRKPDATATFKNLTQQMKVDIREELNTYKRSEMDVHEESNLAVNRRCQEYLLPLTFFVFNKKYMEKPELKRLKILSMGDAEVGKSCIIKRFCEGKFIQEYVATIGIDYGVKNFKTHLEDVKINFWDCGGEDAYLEIRNEFYKDTHAAFLVFDVNDSSTFENLTKWFEEFKKYSSKEELVFFLVGNKTDKDLREVNSFQGEELAAKYNARYYETSAQSGQNIEAMFSELFYAALAANFKEYAPQ